MDKHTLRLRRWIGGLLLLFCGLLAVAKWAEAHGGIPNHIHTCVTKSGEVRFVHPDETCGENETPWDWPAA